LVRRNVYAPNFSGPDLLTTPPCTEPSRRYDGILFSRGKKGGKTRANKLSAEKRKEIARNTTKAWWEKKWR
jgi:hypothetical protein